jgi:hypothetical protein
VPRGLMPRAAAAFLLSLLVLPGASGRAASPSAEETKEVLRGCPPERAQDGEVRLVFLADSGYGHGFSEWGGHGQESVASQIDRLRLQPDLVFFLGDNVYWRGSADLYKARFDDMYDGLIRQCKAHVALGNHDLKGCRAVSALEQWESCLAELRTAATADRKARYMRQGLDEEQAARRAEAEAKAETSGELAEKALAERKANCLPGDATAYEDTSPGKKTCNAGLALAHAQFGFGSVLKGEGDAAASLRQRYYSILWPLPKLTRAGGKPDPAAGPPPKPLVEVIVMDSNTLAVDGGLLEGQGSPPREDQLQLLWFRNALSQWLPAPGEKHRIWKIVAMHHPLYTPEACACRIFGRCIGSHETETGLQAQISKAAEGLEPPDLFMAAHNHIYARSHPLDASGKPVTSGTGGVRYFVTGGGGAPLYAVRKPDPRFAIARTMYHFLYMRLTPSTAFYWAIDSGGKVKDSGCFDKGSNVDHPLGREFMYDDALPAQCAPEGR